MIAEIPQIRVRAEVPDCVLMALSRRRGKYSDIVSVFHCIRVDQEHWIGVAGDGDNGSYEHFSLNKGKLECSDVGYGDSLVALRDVLAKEIT